MSRRPTFFYEASGSSLGDDPAVAGVYRQASSLSLDDAPPGLAGDGGETPPGLAGASVGRSLDPAVRWFLPHKPFAETDALSGGALGAGRGATLVSFDADEKRSAAMSRWEKEGVSRTHLGQLTTSAPEVEDYYYRAYVRRLKEAAGGAAPLGAGTVPGIFLPMPTPDSFPRARRRDGGNDGAGSGAAVLTMGAAAGLTHREDGKGGDQSGVAGDGAEELKKVLGRAGASSSRRPRTMLSLGDEASMSRAAPSVAAQVAAEDAWAAVVAAEDASRAPRPLRDEDRIACDERAAQLLRHAVLGVDVLLSSDAAGVLSGAKGPRMVGRLVRIMRPGAASDWLGAVVRGICAASILRSDSRREKALVDGLLAALVPHMGALDALDVLPHVRLLVSTLGERLLDATCRSRALLVLQCVLLSRLQILRRDDPAAVPPLAPVAELFGLLAPGLADVVSAHEASDAFYAWQLMALFGLLLDGPEEKRALVLGLRELIMAAVRAPDAAQLSNVDIFLHALGLDSAQLRD